MLATDSLENKPGQSIRFKVQVAASSDPIPMEADYFKGHENVQEHQVEGKYKYTIGQFSDYQKAGKFKKKIRQDFPGAFIVAFKDEQNIPVKKALSESNQQ